MWCFYSRAATTSRCSVNRILAWSDNILIFFLFFFGGGGKMRKCRKKNVPSWTRPNLHQRKEKKRPKHAFFNDPSLTLRGLSSPLSHFFPFSFCQISSAGPSHSWSVAFRLHYSPKARPPPPSSSSVYPHSRPSSALTGTKVVPSVLSSQVPISSSVFSSFLPPKTRPESSVFCRFSSPKIWKDRIQLYI